MLDENRDRRQADAEAGRIPQTRAGARSVRIAALVRKNRALLHRLALAASLLIVSISLLFFVRTIIKVDPRQLQAIARRCHCVLPMPVMLPRIFQNVHALAPAVDQIEPAFVVAADIV